MRSFHADIVNVLMVPAMTWTALRTAGIDIASSRVTVSARLRSIADVSGSLVVCGPATATGRAAVNSASAVADRGISLMLRPYGGAA